MYIELLLILCIYVIIVLIFADTNLKLKLLKVKSDNLTKRKFHSTLVTIAGLKEDESRMGRKINGFLYPKGR